MKKPQIIYNVNVKSCKKKEISKIKDKEEYTNGNVI
ncbi:hypothetical protein ES705_20690 [subsurface metagenome]